MTWVEGSDIKVALTQGSPAPSGDICGCHTWGAPGMEGVGSRMLLSPPECSGRPHRMTWPCVHSAQDGLRSRCGGVWDDRGRVGCGCQYSLGI